MKFVRLLGWGHGLGLRLALGRVGKIRVRVLLGMGDGGNSQKEQQRLRSVWRQEAAKLAVGEAEPMEIPLKPWHGQMRDSFFIIFRA
jgi:hypothetical protein